MSGETKVTWIVLAIGVVCISYVLYMTYLGWYA